MAKNLRLSQEEVLAINPELAAPIEQTTKVVAYNNTYGYDASTGEYTPLPEPVKIGYTFDGSCLDYFEYYISCFVPDTSFYTYPDYEKMFDLKGISKFNYSQWNHTPIEKENQHYGMVQNLTHRGNLMNNKKTAKFVDDDLINNN